MNTDLLIPLLTVGGTLLLVVTGLLNFSVFVRQLRAARDQLETARRQLGEQIKVLIRQKGFVTIRALMLFRI